QMEDAIKDVDRNDIDNARKKLTTIVDQVTEKNRNVSGFSMSFKEQLLNAAKYEETIESYEELEAEEQKMLQKSNKMEQYNIRKKK
ncbi:MAG: hypothetical protein KAS39_04635, partial [Actinomycetia bacterium]|nr:hypothetical protein [Actinomycetes bacterium]